uniref:Uncharacterized protein n=1 Tax=Plectus sambesii TaxID=2011161 RepID=A0A914USF0_9BILA
MPRSALGKREHAIKKHSVYLRDKRPLHYCTTTRPDKPALFLTTCRERRNKDRSGRLARFWTVAIGCALGRLKSSRPTTQHNTRGGQQAETAANVVLAQPPHSRRLGGEPDCAGTTPQGYASAPTLIMNRITPLIDALSSFFFYALSQDDNNNNISASKKSTKKLVRYRKDADCYARR